MLALLMRFMLDEKKMEPGFWFRSDSSPMEERVLIGLIAAFLAIIIYSIIYQVRLTVLKKKKSWERFFQLASEYKLTGHQRNLLLRFVRDYGVHPPNRIFQDSRLFDSCASREIEKIKSGAFAYVNKKMLARQVTGLRKKLGFTFTSFDKYLKTTREIDNNQEITLYFDARDGKKEAFNTSVNSIDDLELSLILPQEERYKKLLKSGMNVSFSFIQRGRARYEGNTKILEVGEEFIHLEHTDSLKVTQQRKFARAPIHGVVEFQVTHTPQGKSSRRKYRGEILDVSAGGIGFTFDKPIPTGTKLLLSMDFEENKFTNISGEVLRANQAGKGDSAHYRVHLEFKEIEPGTREAIYKYIFKKAIF